MDLRIAALTFALIIPAELPDKTFISAVVLSSRYRGLPVWFGAAGALILQAAIAVVAGRFIALLPHRTVEIIVSALFIGGAAYLFFVPEKAVYEEGSKIAAREDRRVGRDGRAEHAGGGPSSTRVMIMTFSVVALAEFGDLTQVLIANLSARYRDALSVFVGASLAFITIGAIGVMAGKTLTRIVPLATVRKLSGVALFVLGVFSAVDAAR